MGSFVSHDREAGFAHEGIGDIKRIMRDGAGWWRKRGREREGRWVAKVGDKHASLSVSTLIGQISLFIYGILWATLGVGRGQGGRPNRVSGSTRVV